MGWQQSFTHNELLIQRTYTRKMVHFFDWVSHVPEFMALNDMDKVWRIKYPLNYEKLLICIEFFIMLLSQLKIC